MTKQMTVVVIGSLRVKLIGMNTNFRTSMVRYEGVRICRLNTVAMQIY